MVKRYIIIVLVAILIVLSLSENHLQEYGTVYKDIEFKLEHDYETLAKNLMKGIKPGNSVTPGPTAFGNTSSSPSPAPGSPTPTLSSKTPAATRKPAQTAPKKNYNVLLNNIKSYLSAYEGTFGIYFLSLSNGQTMGLNAKRNFIAASTIKVPINLYLYNMYSQNKISLDETVTYLEEDYEDGTGSIQYENFGNDYSLRELSRRSIVESDNVAIKMLSRYLDYKYVVDYMDSLVKHATPRDRNATSPSDMAIYLKKLLDMTQTHPETHEVLDFLLHTEFNDRIPLYLPSDIPIAHKIGTQTRAIHDVGIVFAPKPYIICIFSENVDEDTAPEVVAQISKMVYDFSQN
jgi:beta-lactamase class A